MPESDTNALLQRLESMSDADLVARTFRPGELSVTMKAISDVRYAGATKLPPGPPAGLRRQPDGSYTLQQVAVVRVQPTTAITQAQAISKMSMKRSALVGAACGLLAVVISAAAAHWMDVRSREAITKVTMPCLVTSIAKQSVSCRMDGHTLEVAPGKFFPDGRYQLDSIDPSRNGFTAIRITDHLTIVFQVDDPAISKQGK